MLGHWSWPTFAETVSSYGNEHAVADDNHGIQKLLSSGIALTENPRILAVSADGSWGCLDLWYQSPIRPRKPQVWPRIRGISIYTVQVS